MTTLDIAALRARFPALSIRYGDQPFAYFDGPGGTQVPETVIDAVTTYYRTTNANHEGAFATSRASDAIVEAAHAALADFLGVDSDEVIVGANMTTLTFHLSRSICATFAPGDEIIVTGLDHAANVDPWIAAARDRGLVIRWWEPHLEDCTLHLDDLRALLSPRTKLVAAGWASNAVGTINPVAQIAALAHSVGAWAYIDAVHAAPHLSIDARAVDADFVACSTYKFFGPHLGVVYGRRSILAALPAYKVRPAESHFETGTGNFEGQAGALAAIRYLEDVGVMAGSPADAGRRAHLVAAMTAIRDVEMALYRHLHDGLTAIAGVRLLGLTDPAAFTHRTPTAALVVEGASSRDVATALGDEGIAVWDGDFYATGLIERLGFAATGGVVRIGLTHYNTTAEVDRLLAVLGRVAARGQGVVAAAAAAAG
ncbi:MAG: cysteine desulfurase-like protein [Chloroflexi bacterium]|nr:cysteine desulfurase-like protein [Chloroflexota bacterium]